MKSISDPNQDEALAVHVEWSLPSGGERQVRLNLPALWP
jgi:hypothetical protein